MIRYPVNKQFGKCNKCGVPLAYKYTYVNGELRRAWYCVKCNQGGKIK